MNLHNTAKNYNSSSILAHKHDQITFLLIKVETSRLHHFEAYEYPVQKQLRDKLQTLPNKNSNGGQNSSVLEEFQ